MTGLYLNPPTIRHLLWRKKLDTPEINTYGQQMKQCQRRYDKIPFDQGWNGLPSAAVSSAPGSHSARPFETSSRFEGFPLMMRTALVRRRRSVQTAGRHKKHLQAGSRRRSRTEAWTRSLDNKSSILRDSQLSIQHNSVSNRGFVAENCSDRRKSVKGNNRRLSSHRNSLNIMGADDMSSRRQSRSSPLKKSTFPVAPGERRPSDVDNNNSDMNHMNHEKEQLLHALTTLAINSLTSETSSGDAKIPFINYLSPYDRTPISRTPKSFNKHNINSNTLSFDFANCSVNSDKNSDEEFDASFVDVEDGRAGQEQVGKREQINRLRSYLKSSGVGEPAVVTTSASEKANENLYLMKLIKKMRHGLSPIDKNV